MLDHIIVLVRRICADRDPMLLLKRLRNIVTDKDGRSLARFSALESSLHAYSADFIYYAGPRFSVHTGVPQEELV